MSETGLTASRSPLFAFVATVLVPGLGHLYVGNPRLALAMLLTLSVVVQLLLVVPVALGVPTLWGTGLALCMALGFKFALAFDAARRARRHGDAYPLRTYNRAGAYLGFIAASMVLGGVANALRAEYALETYSTPSGTMQPGLREGDHFVVTKLHERARVPARGDVIVFLYPDDPSQTFVKRVVGLPGDSVAEAEDGALIVNGTPWPRRPCEGEAPTCWFETTPDGREYAVHVTAPAAARAATVVPADHVYVRGDHRGLSHDSAHFGPVPVAMIRGKAQAVFWPLERFGTPL